MSLLSVEARDASLAMSYGAGAGSLAAGSLRLRLFDGDPREGASELGAVGGYVAPVFTNDGTAWPDAPSGGEIVSAPVAFPTSTGAWSGTAYYWLLEDAATGGWWDSMPLPDDGINVTAAGVDVSVQVVVNYNSLEAGL